MITNKIKSLLLSISPVGRINRYVKGKKQKTNYVKWTGLYEAKVPACDIKEKLLSSFNHSNLKAKFGDGSIDRKLKIFYVGTDESQDFTGFLQALTQFADCKIFYQRDGTYGQYPGMPGHRGLRAQMSQELESQLAHLALDGWIPDILLMQAWGFTFASGVISRIRKKFRCFAINIGMDERLIFSHRVPGQEQDDGLIGIARECDLVLVTSPECVHWYRSEGIPAYFFPLASDPTVYFPLDVAKVYDVGFIGNCYGLREIMVKDLRRRGLNVHAHGTGWPAGRIPYRDNNKFFNECKIILGIGNVGYCKDLYTLKLRDFDALMSGGVYITHDHPILSSMFENGKELILCKDIGDFEFNIRSLLSDPERRRRIATSGLNKVRQQHCYKNRFDGLMKFLECLKDGGTQLDFPFFERSVGTRSELSEGSTV